MQKDQKLPPILPVVDARPPHYFIVQGFAFEPSSSPPYLIVADPQNDVSALVLASGVVDGFMLLCIKDLRLVESTYRVWVLHGENPYKDRMVDQDVEENDEAEGLRMGNLVDVAYGMHEGLAGDLNGGDESEGGDLEPPYVLEPDLGYLIMSSGQSQHTASQPSSSVPLPSHNLTSDSHTSQPSEASPTITKLPIEFNGDGVAVGPNHAKWNTQVGVYVRARIPIHYKDWRKVDGSFKDNVWNKLMDKEDPSRKHGRVDSWKKGHERRDGTILASAQTHYEQVDASNKRRKEASAGGEGSVMEVDFDNDELSEVFGPDKGSRTRGISSNKSKKQLQRTGIAKALLQQASSSSIRVEVGK
ncbi:hypothetical protein IFM89_005644 [Coptis chinensis]|uniref:Uncharacterized protein n=1 Tax=Coptis chinensis TaxID=261450 RepID=A0A835MHF9_9MAGN|nr:hypothetical protein IFM89_005644 [Coptis chinensis]